MSNKWVYLFGELDQVEKKIGGRWDDVKGMLGGKGANLAEMTRIGIPVPPGFIITTEACNAYLAAGENFPSGMWQQVLQAVQGIEKQTGKMFGRSSNAPTGTTARTARPPTSR